MAFCICREDREMMGKKAVVLCMSLLLVGGAFFSVPSTAQAAGDRMTENTVARPAVTSPTNAARRDRLRGLSGVAAPGATNDNGSAAPKSALLEATGKAGYTPAAALEQRVKEFNVLRYAYIDEESGRVILVGAYDPAFATGAIDYTNLLADALQNLYPAFSLEYRPDDPGVRQVTATMDAQLSQIQRDPQFGLNWMSQLFNPLLRTQENSQERRQLEQNLLRLYGITAEEYGAQVGWDKKTGLGDQGLFDKIAAFNVKAWSGVGVDKAAGMAFMSIQRKLSGGGDDSMRAAWSYLGLNNYIEQLKAEYYAGKLTAGRLEELVGAATYREMLKGFGMPLNEAVSLTNGYLDHRITETVLSAKLNEQADTLMKKAMVQALNGLSFSGQYVARINALPPINSGIRLYGARADSPLMRVFFNSDYTLKYMAHDMGAAQGIAEPKSWLSFYEQAVRQAGGAAGVLPNQGLTRVWLYPGQVQMESFPDGSGVQFGAATVRIGLEAMEAPRGANAAGQAFFQRALAQYGEALTRSYDAYARVYPSLHVMRETEKIIALARWLKARNVAVQLDPVAPVKPVPGTVEGFWGLTYMVQPQGAVDHMYLWLSGGVDFGQNQGANWVREQASPAAADHVLQQLAVSNALANQAADAALQGNLESARELAEKSAQAMTGQFDVRQFQNISPVPADGAPQPADKVGKQAAVAADVVAALDANVAALDAARKGLGNGAGGDAQAAQERSAANLQKLQTMVQDYQRGKVSGRELAVDLRSLNPNANPAVGSLKPAGNVDQQPPTPPGDGNGRCADWKKDQRELTLEQKAVLAQKLQVARERLKHINEALLRLAEINARDTKQLNELTQGITADYEASVDRLGDVMQDLLIGLPSGKLGEIMDQYKAAAKGYDADISGLIARKTTPLDAAALKSIDDELTHLYAAKYRTEDMYRAMEIVVASGSGAGTAATSGGIAAISDDDKRIAKGGIELIKLLKESKKVEATWNKYMKNDKFWQATLWANMVYNACGFLEDVVKQQLVWSPLAEQLQNNIAVNSKNMDQLRGSAAQSYKEIQCIENAIK